MVFIIKMDVDDLQRLRNETYRGNEQDEEFLIKRTLEGAFSETMQVMKISD